MDWRKPGWRYVTALLWIYANVVTSLPAACDGQLGELCYVLSGAQTMTWSAADDACAQQGGRLVSVTTVDRQRTLVEILVSRGVAGGVWIGGRAETHATPVWRWISDCGRCGISVYAADRSAIESQGCYDEYYGNPDFNVQMNLDDVTPHRCITACDSRNYTYAALQEGSKCFCGNSFGKHGAQGGCTVRCAGDPSLTCGGYGVNHVLKIGGVYGVWGYNQPNNNDDFENCGALYHPENYKFADKNCREQFRFLCEIPSCPSQMAGDGQFRMLSGRCVYVSRSDDRRSWWAARRACLARGGDLAAVRSAGDHDAVAAWLARRPPASGERFTWVGLTRVVWYWTDGSDIRFSNYADDEPRDVDSRCLYADGSDGGLWKTGECGARRAYVCGIDLVTTTATAAATTTRPFITSSAPTTPSHAVVTTTTTTPVLTTRAGVTSARTSSPTSSPAFAPTSSTALPPTKGTTSANASQTTSPVTSQVTSTNGSPQTGSSTANSGSLATVYWVLLAIVVFLLLLIVIILVIIICHKHSKKRDGRVTPQRKYDARGNAQLPNNGPLPLGGEPHPYTEDLSSRTEMFIDRSGWKSNQHRIHSPARIVI